MRDFTALGTFILSILILILSAYRHFIDLKHRQTSTDRKLTEDEKWMDEVLENYKVEIKELSTALHDLITNFKVFSTEQTVLNRFSAKSMETVVSKIEIQENALRNLIEKIANVEMKKQQ